MKNLKIVRNKLLMLAALAVLLTLSVPGALADQTYQASDSTMSLWGIVYKTSDTWPSGNGDLGMYATETEGGYIINPPNDGKGRIIPNSGGLRISSQYDEDAHSKVIVLQGDIPAGVTVVPAESGLIFLDWKTDSHGVVENWVLQGDANANHYSEPGEWIAICDYVNSRPEAVTSEQGRRNSEINESVLSILAGKGTVNTADWVGLLNAMNSSSTPPYYHSPNACLSYGVEDIVDIDYRIKEISLTINGEKHSLNIPAVSSSGEKELATTPIEVNGQTFTYTVVRGISAEYVNSTVKNIHQYAGKSFNTYTVYGPALATNVLEFIHEPMVEMTLTYGSDEYGEVTDWMLTGDTNADGRATWRAWLDISRYLADAMDESDTIYNLSPEDQVQALRNSDIEHRKAPDAAPGPAAAVDHMDWIYVSRFYALAPMKLPYIQNSILGIAAKFTFSVTDKPKEGFHVSKITYTNENKAYTLALPGEANTPKVTPIDGYDYTVTLDDKGLATVDGLSWSTNDVFFEHARDHEELAALDYSTDGNGDVTDWLFRGDVNRDGRIVSDEWRMENDTVVLNKVSKDYRNMRVAITNETMLQRLARPDIRPNSSDWSVLNDFCIQYYSNDLPFAVAKDKSEYMDFAVVDTPKAGYTVSKITYTNDSGAHELTLPQAANAPQITKIDGHDYTVLLDDKGMATVYGPSWKKNAVHFEHTKPVQPTAVPTAAPTPVPVDKNDFYFFFTKKWQGEPGADISFTLYNADGSVHPHEFRKTKVSATEWKYECWLSRGGDYYVLEDKLQGYSTAYANTGLHASDTDRCYNGGTITNTQAPKTGDSSTPALWGMLLAVSLLGMALHVKRRARG